MLPLPGPLQTARRGGVTGTRTPHTLGLGRPLVPSALRTEDPGGRAGGAGTPVRVREGRLPLPRPALLGQTGRRGLCGGAAPRERQVRGRPTQGQRVWGRYQGTFLGLCSALTDKAVRPSGDHALP